MKVLLELITHHINIRDSRNNHFGHCKRHLYKLRSESVWLARLDCDTAFIIRLV